MADQATLRGATIHELIGSASACWSETPQGIFDSDTAKEIGDEIERRLAAERDRAEQLTRRVREFLDDLAATHDITERIEIQCPYVLALADAIGWTPESEEE